MPRQPLATRRQIKEHEAHTNHRFSWRQKCYAIGAFALEHGCSAASTAFGVSRNVARYWRTKLLDPTFHPRPWGRSEYNDLKWGEDGEALIQSLVWCNVQFTQRSIYKPMSHNCMSRASPSRHPSLPTSSGAGDGVGKSHVSNSYKSTHPSTFATTLNSSPSSPASPPFGSNSLTKHTSSPGTCNAIASSRQRAALPSSAPPLKSLTHSPSPCSPTSLTPTFHSSSTCERIRTLSGITHPSSVRRLLLGGFFRATSSSSTTLRFTLALRPDPSYARC
ncbi:uncharacterized protein ACA1_221630 [Acanthamoeba castellanii str. Neff]|uniref:Uncharacterized protein n=1 Tax=Acanthamoeba castellanii (strain ATCC 30010 / Neff) TaxID=1257118 RepID=L8GSR2_ACACF|nr:uncharacterized protein ACA1_221630 [Acanthamoeba castellanii str. Neff]ELR15987.1 hypothetical protein ACA1_221630 [Acanthamoeba castellanii str. Neff]